MKKIIPIIVILAFAVGAYWLLRGKSETVITQEPNSKETTKTNSLIDKTLATEKNINEADNYTIFKIIYPQFKNVSSEFNKKIEDQVNTGIAQQKKDTRDNWQARFDTQSKGENIPQYPKEADKFYFDVSWKPIQENEKFVSMVLTISAYEGGAHGYETLTSYNYDVTSKKEVVLADLFPNDSNYLKTISDFSRQNLTEQFKKRLEVKTKTDLQNFQDTVVPMMEDGTTPNAENFSVFTFTPETITIYFNQYQVAPYAMGGSAVAMPRK